MWGNKKKVYSNNLHTRWMNICGTIHICWGQWTQTNFKKSFRGTLNLFTSRKETFWTVRVSSSKQFIYLKNARLHSAGHISRESWLVSLGRRVLSSGLQANGKVSSDLISTECPKDILKISVKINKVTRVRFHHMRKLILYMEVWMRQRTVQNLISQRPVGRLHARVAGWLSGVQNDLGCLDTILSETVDWPLRSLRRHSIWHMCTSKRARNNTRHK
jgi:hypothetical protein